MTNVSGAEILQLPIQPCAPLVELIGESTAAIPPMVEVSPQMKAELRTRLATFERDPEAGYTWDQVKGKLKDGSWRNG
jgi:putative addiction module component (TIGR02574 family)